MPNHNDLNVLLDLNGYIYHLGKDGYWVKFEAHAVAVTDHKPHGISYSITLHDRHNRRVVGFDNAHGFTSKSKRKKFGCSKVTWDHKHNCEKISEYEFESAGQLLVDFWEEVDKIV
jgi:hypothetical protein